MPAGYVAPITGKLRKNFIFDLTISLGSGTILALGFWYGIHIPRIAKRTSTSL